MQGFENQDVESGARPVLIEEPVSSSNPTDSTSDLSGRLRELQQGANGSGCQSGAFINEFRYQNSGDPGEGPFIELAGPAGTSLTNFEVVRFNGDGTLDQSFGAFFGSSLRASPNTGSSLGIIILNAPGIPDIGGVMLKDPAGVVCDFVSWGVTLTTPDSFIPAGVTSFDIGLPPTDNANESFGRIDDGSASPVFVRFDNASPGKVNQVQIDTLPPPPSLPPGTIVSGCPSGVFVNEVRYQDSGSSAEGDFIELAGPVGTDVSQLSLTGFTFGFPDRFFDFDFGAALVGDPGSSLGFNVLFPGNLDSTGGVLVTDRDGVICDFVSWGGAFITDDPNSAFVPFGIRSVDIGLTASANPNESFGRVDDGTGAPQWARFDNGATPGLVNQGQLSQVSTFPPPSPPVPPVAVPVSPPASPPPPLPPAEDPTPPDLSEEPTPPPVVSSPVDTVPGSSGTDPSNGVGRPFGRPGRPGVRRGGPGNGARRPFGGGGRAGRGPRNGNGGRFSGNGVFVG